MISFKKNDWEIPKIRGIPCSLLLARLLLVVLTFSTVLESVPVTLIYFLPKKIIFNSWINIVTTDI